MTATAHRPSSTARARPPGGSDRIEHLARFGLLGKGVLHAVIGLLALELALNGSSSSEASTSGALRWIADRPLGVPALWAMGLSLLALAAWRGITAVTGDPVEESDGVHRAAWAFKALLYGALALLSLRAALDGGTTPSGSGAAGGTGSTSSAASTVFDWPMGRWIVVFAGLAVIGLGAYLIVQHAVRAEFSERLRASEGSTPVLLGRVGYGLRSVAYLLVGAFLAQAGLAGQEDRAEGLSGALQRVADARWGTALLLAVAVGFLAYGAYCVVESRLRRDA